MCTSCPLLQQAHEYLTAEEYAEIMRKRISGTFDEDVTLFTEGGICLGVYCLQSGRVAILRRDAEDEDHVVYIANPGDLLGITGTFIGPQYTNTARTLERTSCCFLPADVFLVLARRCPNVIVQAMKQLCHRIGSLEYEHE